MERSQRWIIAAPMIVAAFLGGLMSNVVFRAVPEAHAQADPKVPPLRLQISGYGAAMPSGELKAGVFLIDTWTGEVYHAAQFQGFQKFARFTPKD